MNQFNSFPVNPNPVNPSPINPINPKPINPAPVNPVPINNPVSKKKSPLMSMIIAVVITAIIIGGGIYWWGSQTQAELNGQIASLNNQVGQLQTTISSLNSQKSELSDKLMETGFRLAALNFWQVKDVFRDSQDKNKFYYVTNAGDGSNIWAYDLTKDTTYKQGGTFNITEGNTLLLNQKPVKGQEFRGVGITDNQFVFVQTKTTNLPASCFSPWLYPNLESINLGTSSSTLNPFTLSAEMTASEQQKVADCEKNL